MGGVLKKNKRENEKGNRKEKKNREKRRKTKESDSTRLKAIASNVSSIAI